MAIERKQLLTNGLPTCENCEWHIYTQESEFIICLLNRQEKGLVQSCDRFKYKTGSHVTV